LNRLNPALGLYTFPNWCTLVFHVVQDQSERGSHQRARRTEHSGRNRRVIQYLLIFVAAVIFVDGLVGERGLVAMVRARRQHDALAATIAREQAENGRLREEARRLREDPMAIEEIARRDLGLIKPGEKVFILKDVIQQPSQK